MCDPNFVRVTKVWPTNDLHAEQSFRKRTALKLSIVFVSVLWMSLTYAAEVRIGAHVGGLDALFDGNVEVPKSAALNERDDDHTITFVLVFLGGTDLFGINNLSVRASSDPFIAFQSEITNLTDSEQSFFLRLGLPIVNTGAVVQSDVFMDWRVLDTNESGEASVIFGQAAATLGTEKGFFPPFVTPPFNFNYGVPAFEVTEIDTVQRVMDRTDATPDPTSAQYDNSEFFTTLELQALGGSLSPGDTVLIQGYACIADATQSCGARPDLNVIFASTVPLPPAILFLASGLFGLMFRRRR